MLHNGGDSQLTIPSGSVRFCQVPSCASIVWFSFLLPGLNATDRIALLRLANARIRLGQGQKTYTVPIGPISQCTQTRCCRTGHWVWGSLMNPEWHGGATGKSRRSQSFNSARFHPRNFGTCYSNLFGG